MLRYLIILLLPLSLFSQTEEKRLALVIGNSNYDKGPLNNPVNDALLMARTLDSLDFDVILDTNIENKSAFVDVVMEFGDKRPEYDVAFVYYAGHGVQVGAENYLLPTKVDFQKETDVRMKAMSVQDIMMYLTGMTNQVNILVLDACRDNPFEGNWNKTRSLKGGGLARIPPPTGSLIAFSTDAGNTAADGDGENSIYCQSLCENMMLENTSLDQVFRNVRSDVLKRTNRNQRPVEASQLTGDAFYLVKSNFSELFEEVYELIKEINKIGQNDILQRSISEENILKSIELCNKIIYNDQNNTRALSILGDLYRYMGLFDKAKKNYRTCISLDSNNTSALYGLASSYEELDNISDSDSLKKAIYCYERIIKFNPLDFNAFNRLGIVYHFYLDDYKKALKYYNMGLEINPEFNKIYVNRAVLFTDLKRFEEALLDYDKSLELMQNNGSTNEQYAIFYQNKARLYFKMSEFEKSLSAINKGIEFNSERIELYENRAELYEFLSKQDDAKKDYLKVISLQSKDAYGYWYSGTLYSHIFMFNEAIESFTKSIQFQKDNASLISYRAQAYADNGDFLNAIKDFTSCINLEPEDASYYNNRGVVYMLMGNYSKAIYDFDYSIRMDQDANTYKNRAVCHTFEGNYEKSLNDLNSAIELNIDNEVEFQEKTDGSDGSYYTSKLKLYYSRGILFDFFLKNDSLALVDYQKQIKIEPNDFLSHAILGNLYFSLGDTNYAFKKFDYLVDEFNDISLSYSIRGKFNYLINKHDKSINDYNQAILIDEMDPEPYFWIGENYLKMKKYYKALEFYNTSLFLIERKNNSKYITSEENLLCTCFDNSHVEFLATLPQYKNPQCQKNKSHIIMKIASIYKKLGIKDVECTKYEELCKLGDCELFNENCK